MAELIFGLDLGVSSIGWAVVRDGLGETESELIAAGAHVFEAGVDGGTNKISEGKDEPRAAARRVARLSRRQLARRAIRRRQLLRLLIDLDLLPKCDPEDAPRIDAMFKDLDRGLVAKWCRAGIHSDQLNWLYRLRAAALQQPLARHEFGRAIFHLAQRRGFLSNRKDASKPDESLGEVKAAISKLEADIASSGLKTLGAYLASLDPEQVRLRGRWTHRSMYRFEFDSLWSAQHGALALDDQARRKILRAIFFQRPLKPAHDLIGRCSLIPEQRRAPLSLRLVQRFRVLQEVNNLRLVQQGTERPLSSDERAAVLQAILAKGSVTYSHLRSKVLKLKQCIFNMEEGEKKSPIGHRTDSKLKDALGEHFDRLSETQLDALVADLRSIVRPEAMARRAQQHWGFPPDVAQALSEVGLEDGHAAYSLEAIRQLMPRLEAGEALETVRRELFPESVRSTEPLDLLPPLQGKPGDALPLMELRNPTVSRALTELRMIVNALIRRHGKPDRVRIELARDLKNSRDARQDIHKRNQEQEKRRDAARATIVAGTAVSAPSRSDVERLLLWEECNRVCPYTGRPISLNQLIGAAPEVDVEHIWPFSQSFDDSFANKTLCFADENRSRKRQHTPFDAYSADPVRWAAILDRVRGFRGRPQLMREKLRRFEAQEIDADFTNRHLSDTRYITRKAAEYLDLLFGGRVDVHGKRRVETPTGQVTAWLRREWRLSEVLGDREKTRQDHRHHAVDAVVIAFTSPRMHAALSRAAASSEQAGSRRLFKPVEPPYPGLIEDARRIFSGLIVSHRQSRRVRGKLHADTIYSKPIAGTHRVRKELHNLTEKDVDRIVDSRIRRLVLEAWQRSGIKDITKAFAEPANLPVETMPDGRTRRIRHVRINAGTGFFQVGSGHRARIVGSTQGSNHHAVIMAKVGPAGDIAWQDQVVPLREVYRRKAKGLPLVDRTCPAGYEFRFSISRNEYIEMDSPNGTGRRIYRVLSLSDGDIELVEHQDARPSGQRNGADRVRARGANKLLKLNARKKFVNCIGEIFDAGG
jgi:CRISPR-associated endonuclease Csn1